MEKLSINHLSPYLPYKLHVIDMITNKQKVMNLGQGASTNWIGIKTVLNYYKSGNFIYKPILRPLSDLTIEDAIRHEYPSESHLERSLLSSHAPHGVWLEYVGQHFDVFGLIEKGLVISINDINP